MKKLSLYVFLVLMFCNISFAETYVCITDDIHSEKTTFTRLANNKFELKVTEEGNLGIVDLYDENADFIYKNNISEVNSNLNKKYNIPVNFVKVYELNVNGIKIYEIFKKIK